jgi:diadenosine tetraphosphatase ApaH/serine/threonine PP2A family protein phosphatase
VERSRELGKVFVRGNHDKAATGLMDLKDFNAIAAMAAEWTHKTLTPANLEWLRALPQGPVQLDGLASTQFVHGSPLDEDDYVVSVRDAVEPLLMSSIPLTFFGHTHLQGGFEVDGVQLESFRPPYKTVGQSEISEFRLKDGLRYLINPGSVGQPRDGDWRAGFAVFDSETRVITFCRVPYNLKSAQDRIMQANLPQRLAARLAMGR